MYLVPIVQQPSSQIRADKAGRACDGDTLHARSVGTWARSRRFHPLTVLWWSDTSSGCLGSFKML
jgi:hypothetical protein